MALSHALLGIISETAPSSPKSGDFWYKIDHSAKSVTLMKYSGSAWDNATENNKEAYDEIADQIFALREKRQQASMDTVQRDEQLQRITELQDFIKDQSSDLTVFDETLVKRWLKQIVIWPTHCTVELKSGLKVDVER